ncbi:MAG TPA: aminotransferase class I/II-fold pyridoxal phosphate-dependent enzyme [Ktedonobacterales bacterium]|nr:aminotransferase class I/II-fold pyridoxal phosphate-dependent enzyme [Ktedonobacterales bacterium]
MAHITSDEIRPLTQSRTSRVPRVRRLRHIALLGGTTTWGDVLAAVRSLLTPQRLLQGPDIAQYERAFAQHSGVRWAFSFANGRVGLYGILQALGVGPGDEVLLQAPTHIVVANAIRYLGAHPVYVDCDPDTFNIDLAAAERLITPRTRVLLLQHTFGVPVDLDAAIVLAHRHGLALVEDCVHALGATYRGRPVGSFGRAAFFSSEETKIISTTFGGMATTDDPAIAAYLRTFQAHCSWPSRWLVARSVLKFALYRILMDPYLHRPMRALYELMGRRLPLPRPTSPDEERGERPAGFESRLSNAQAVLGVRQLRGLDRNLAHRRMIAQLYERLLSERGVRVSRVPEHMQPSYVRYPVWAPDRDAAQRAVNRYALPGLWFTSVLEDSTSPAAGAYQPGSCPHAEAAAQHLINLPTHPRVTLADAQVIASAMASTLVVTPHEDTSRQEKELPTAAEPANNTPA